MHLPIGSFVNGGAIILGSLVGLALHSRFPDRIREIVFQGLGLCTTIIGLQMALKVENILLMIFSILIGGILGELMNLELAFEKIANKLKKTIKSKNELFTDGLITSSLLFCIGAMAIIGAFDEGIRGDANVLYTKSILDAFASIALASTYGTGVIFSAIPVFLYQASLTIFAESFQHLFSPLMITQLTATGGLLIIGISLSLLDIKRVRLGNMLPALPMSILLTACFG
ncbi:MAG: DUF554 domain-containing protein [Desulfovibrio sp.]